MISKYSSIFIAVVVFSLMSLITMIVSSNLNNNNINIHVEAAPSSYINLFFSHGATLLSGGLTDCATPSDITATDCEGGIAAADAYIRNFTNTTNEASLFSWELDRNSPFVQMHPLDWGVNRMILQNIFNYSHFRATHATLQSTRNLTYLQDENFPFVLSNALIPPSSLWVPYAETIHFDDTTKIALCSIQSGAQPNSFDSLASAVSALTIIARRSNGPWYPVIIFDDETLAFTTFVSHVTDSSKVVLKPAAIISILDEIAFYQANGSWVGGVDVDEDNINHHRFGIHPTTPSAFETIEQVIADVRNIDNSIKDYYYILKQTELKTQSSLAAANDPVVGQSGLMPVTRTGDFRICYGGPCPLGELWTSALRWAGDADIAIEGSGGIRGPGWAGPNVQVSDIWGALPFANSLCTAKVSGVTLYKMFNFSVTLATFTSTKTDFGDRLLQVAGARVTYNTNLPETNRLVSIDVLNRQTNQYEPVERLKIYKLATNSFICSAFDPFPDFLKAAEIEGEVAATIGDRLVQELVADYLGSLSAPYDTTVEGRLRNDTSGVAMSSLVQTRATCAPNTFWKQSTLTCVGCANGFVNPNPQDSDSCVAAKEDTNIVPIAVGIAVPVALLILGAVFYYFYRKDKLLRENVRDLENAPKKSFELTALCFSDIQSSTKLWSTAPQSMSVALETHNNIINEILARNSAFLIKNIGDAVFFAKDCSHESGNGAQTAAKICVEIQRGMMAAAFPSAINHVYQCETDEELLDVYDDPNDLVRAEEGSQWHGLRIRLGLAIGTDVEVKFDPATKSYDYFGSLSNYAARTESSAHGGQILVTSESLPHINAAALDSMLTSFGKFELKGIPDPKELHQLMPVELLGRKKLIGSGEKAKKMFEASAGLDDDTKSNASSAQDSNASVTAQESEDTMFLNALLRACKPKEKENILRTLENSWRIRHGKSNQDTVVSIAKKVGKVKVMMAQQEERKAVRDGRTAVTGYSNGTENARAMMNTANTRMGGQSSVTPSNNALANLARKGSTNSNNNNTNKYQAVYSNDSKEGSDALEVQSYGNSDNLSPPLSPAVGATRNTGGGFSVAMSNDDNNNQQQQLPPPVPPHFANQ